MAWIRRKSGVKAAVVVGDIDNAQVHVCLVPTTGGQSLLTLSLQETRRVGDKGQTSA